MLFISNSGESLPIVWRLRNEGADADIYLHNSKYHGNYAGIIKQKVTIAGLKKACSAADIIIFDITRPNDRSPSDLAMLKMFGLKTSSSSVFGPVADKLRKHALVIGCSEWSEEIELDRKLGSDIAKKVGMAIAPTQDFKSIKAGIKFLEGPGKGDRWVLKPHNNGDLDLTYVEKWPGELAARMKGDLPGRIGSDSFEFMLQQCVDGVELSSEGWWDGKAWMHFNRTFEEKKMFTGNLGPSIGSQNNVVWISKNSKGILMDQFRRLEPWLKESGYVGPIDINSIISEKDQKAYFLEFSPRFGYDAIYNLFTMFRDSLTSFFTNGFQAGFKDGFSASQRISIPPYPYAVPQLLNKFAKDVAITGELENMPWFWAQDLYLRDGKALACAGSDAILGVVAEHGETMWKAVDGVYAHIKRFKVSQDLQYRKDLGIRAERHLKKLSKWGVEVD